MPPKKAVTCLEDLQCFTVKEFKEILKGYKEKTFGCKSDLMLRVYAIYCRISSNPHLPQNSLDGDQPMSFEAFFKRECLLLSCIVLDHRS